MQNSKLNQNKANSIFDLNIPRKINYYKSFNKTIIEENNSEEKTNTKKYQIRKVSNFNPYDIGYLKINNEENMNKTKIKPKQNKNYIYTDNLETKSENKENDMRQSNLIKPQDNKYLSLNYKYKQNLMTKFNTPKIKKNINNTKKETPEYLIKIKKQKNQYFTDLKNAMKNKKIRSTNYSSNGRTDYNYYDNNNNNDYVIKNNDNKKSKIKDTSFNKQINKIHIHKSNKQFFPCSLNTLEKYLKFKSFLKKTSKELKNKIILNKSANNLKVSKNSKYITIGKNKPEQINNNNKNENKNENNLLRKNSSFLTSFLYCLNCCGN